MCDKVPFGLFRLTYNRTGQEIEEYILRLSTNQKKSIFDYLERKTSPQNSEYAYDYFSSNCSTNIAELLQQKG